MGPITALAALLPLLAQDTTSRHFLGVQHPLTPARSAAPEVIATDYLWGIAPGLGLSAADLRSVFLAKQYVTQTNGVTHILFKQRYLNADVLNGEWVVNIDRDGQVLNAGGNLYPTPKMKALPLRTRARLAANKAVAAVNPKLAKTFSAVESNTPVRSPHSVRFAASGLATELEGQPVWFAHQGELRAAWNFFVADEDRLHRYSVTVADWDQEILRNQPLTFSQSAAPATPRGLVFRAGEPAAKPKAWRKIERSASHCTAIAAIFRGRPAGLSFEMDNRSANGWQQRGRGRESAGDRFCSPTPSEGTGGEFSFPLQLGPGTNPLNYRDAANTNLFYWVNRAHDLHYLAGFDEAAGNFQMENFGRGGVGGDPIYAYTHFATQALVAGSLENAFFSWKDVADGAQAEIAMFLSAAPGPNGDFFTDGSYDSLVIVHEYTHGVSSRLANSVYSTFQGASMGEAWSDFFGLEFTLPNGADPDGIYPTGEYFDQSWGVGDIRSRPYSTNLDLNALTFANLGHVISRPEVHGDGEIWMEALWEIRSNLIKQFGEAEGRRRVRQLVIDGMKLQVPAATMVDARDGILLADRVDFKGASQDQLWAGFAKRGFGALAFSDGGATTHVASSFDPPSVKGAVRFYDSTMVAGEPARIILEDANYTAPSVLVQVTSTAGDVEDVILRRNGSIYTGSVRTALGLVNKQNGRVELAPSDFLDVFYLDQNTGSGAKLITASATMMQPYQPSTEQNSFSFSGESRITITSAFSRVQLPFQFPFFDKTYGTALVYGNGLIAFDIPVLSTSCTDFNALSRFPAIAPLWNPLSLTGGVQPNEGLFVSRTASCITFRWAGENTPVGGQPSPVNFAATLFSDGRTQFNYGEGNQTVASSSVFNTCGTGPTVGISNGHDVYTANYVLPTYTKGLTFHLDPPFNPPSTPSANLLLPKQGDHVQDILTVSGTATDSAALVQPIDIFIDNVQRARVSAVQGTFTTNLNLEGLGISSGMHTLKIRVSNGRGAIAEFPTPPLTFFRDTGQAASPVIKIEQPAEGAVVTGPLSVMGYAYDLALRIAGVDTLIDGFVYATTAYGIRRNDVCDPLNPKPVSCPGVGFRALFATVQSFPPIQDGPHSLQVRVRDETGRLSLYPEKPINFSVKNGTAATISAVLSNPASNATLSGTVTVDGYVYAPGGKISTVLLIVDNVTAYPVKFNQPRPDVCAGLPDADACPNIGFTVDFDTRRLLNGPHSFGIYAVTDQGTYDQFPKLVSGGINVFVKN